MTSPAPARSHEERFVDYLRQLDDREDRAPLAALRRGLGHTPGEVAEAYRYVVPWLPQQASLGDEQAYYLVATLFALHPQHWDDAGERATNLGASFRLLDQRLGGGGGAERRFAALLNSARDDLPEHLRHAVALLRTKEVPVDWVRLLRDLRAWGRADRRVQREWARAYWGAAPEAASGAPDPATATDTAQSQDE